MAKYDDLKEKARGSFATVYVGQDNTTRQKVVLKIFKHDSEKDGFPASALREIAILKKLHHKNIISVLEVGTQRGQACLVFEFIEMDLAEFLGYNPDGISDKSLRKDILYQILDGIGYCHSNGVFHLDLKPRNLMIDTDTNVIKIADFGLSATFEKSTQDLTTTVATLGYRAPEILLGAKNYSAAVDIWSIGCIFAEMVCGRPLFPIREEHDQLCKIFSLLGTPNEDSWKGVSELPEYEEFLLTKDWDPKKLDDIPNIDEAEKDLLSKMLRLDPSKRISARNALAHRYFDDCEPEDNVHKDKKMKSVTEDDVHKDRKGKSVIVA